MQITLSWQTIITTAAIVGAFVALATYLKKLFGWFDKQEKQDKDIQAIKEEQSILVLGVLACLRGLAEQGVDGPVTEGIAKLEAHLNARAHQS
jgi:hypothetical protein